MTGRAISHSMISIENLIEEYQPEFNQVDSAEMQVFLSQLQNIVASNNTLILKTVAELLPLRFFVDDYQRGYKWLKQQVEELLNDIHEFEPGDDSFYCLQPVVVKHHCTETTGLKGRWELIDGQQRMTTVFMILAYLQHDSFSIDYQTRASSSLFLRNYLPLTLESENWDDFLDRQNLEDARETELDNVDNYHFYRAYKTIDCWFSDESRFADDTSKKYWLNKLLQYTKVIWYAAREDNTAIDKLQSIDIFMRINSGKIPLTNAELIKALYLNCVVNTGNRELALLQQSEMAQQWDMVEHGLQGAEFWAFLNPSDCLANSATRIELLFDLISGKPEAAKRPNSEEQDKYFAFNYYNRQLKSCDSTHVRVLKLWHEVKQGYYRLLEWYNDDELYHLVGFLISRNISNIQKLWKLADQKSKSDFAYSLKELIAQELRKYFKSESGTDFLFTQVQYDAKSRSKIISILILFNIGVHRTNRTRLSFKTYRDTSWDIEHIHAQQSQELNDQAQAESWFEDQIKILESDHIPSTIKAKLEEKLHAWHSSNASSEPNCKELRNAYLNALLDVVGEISDEEAHGLDNLCLLSATVNRGIGNEIFSMKRQLIINYEKGNQFIPIATKNVFSKFYCTSVSQMHKWSADDRSSYREALITSFEYFLGKGVLV
ncbi:DUF262 domain-containing protein [Shewanella psychropiezotolerans]|uniref:DUF262 domain-containing protein n=1 Tax=Shewanella psychropiezotolerans TaxID=2593655 RepID=A0ABX5WWB4_9GAMM|nr:DUF262 domain-containing protein [Shewanella psychropiezotolerans]QDO82462.1 DUF262 domain-containing protein [Shewanella psychropiezotolerans]